MLYFPLTNPSSRTNSRHLILAASQLPCFIPVGNTMIPSSAICCATWSSAYLEFLLSSPKYCLLCSRGSYLLKFLQCRMQYAVRRKTRLLHRSHFSYFLFGCIYVLPCFVLFAFLAYTFSGGTTVSPYTSAPINATSSFNLNRRENNNVINITSVTLHKGFF